MCALYFSNELCVRVWWYNAGKSYVSAEEVLSPCQIISLQAL